jgi:hypothetical protein
MSTVDYSCFRTYSLRPGSPGVLFQRLRASIEVGSRSLSHEDTEISRKDSRDLSCMTLTRAGLAVPRPANPAFVICYLPSVIRIESVRTPDRSARRSRCRAAAESRSRTTAKDASQEDAASLLVAFD